MTFTFGYSGSILTGAGFQFIGIGGNNQVSYNAGTFPGGTIQSISCYLGGHSGAVNAKLCVWDTSGNLLAASSLFSAAAGSGANGGQTWYTQTLASPLALSSQAIYIGWWRDSAGQNEWSFASGSTQYNNAGGSSPSNCVTGRSSGSGQIGAYVTYVKGGIKAWDGSAFNRYALRAWSGAAWNWYAGKVWDGSTWNRNA